jgi:phosphatidylglycerophosphatase A
LARRPALGASRVAAPGGARGAEQRSLLSEDVSFRIDWRWRVIATCFWIGYFPYAPATACSFVVTAFIWLTGALDSQFYLTAVIAVTAVGIAASSVAERQYGRDGHPIVIDEVAGQMITFLAHPPSAAIFIGGFLLFRFFDIVKPFPANRSQKLVSGVGVVADDVVAGIYANVALWALVALL